MCSSSAFASLSSRSSSCSSSCWCSGLLDRSCMGSHLRRVRLASGPLLQAPCYRDALSAGSARRPSTPSPGEPEADTQFDWRLSAVSVGVAVLLGVANSDDPGWDHMRIANDMRDEFLVDRVRLPFRLARETTGQTLRRLVADGELHAKLDHRVERFVAARLEVVRILRGRSVALGI